jgi:16S rRNA (uracil1498-N3)-methyltransferase
LRRIVVSSEVLQIMSPGEVTLARRESHYARHVLRLGVGDEVELLDGRGSRGRGRIRAMEGDVVRVELSEFGQCRESESALSIMLLMGMPKANHWEFILQKTTELGVDQLWPVYTERSEVRVPPDKLDERLERWGRICAESTKQCGRSRAPELLAPVELKVALETLQRDQSLDLQLVAWEKEPSRPGERALEAMLGGRDVHRVVLFVGPEGGLTQAEVQQAALAGFQVVSLGPRILRTETAAIVLTALVQYRLGDLG